MIRSTCRRAATVVGTAVMLTVAGVPLLSGTALAATISASPDSVMNGGTATVTLTGGASMFTATGATLTNHSNPSVTVAASGLSNPSLQNPSQRTATFPLLNKLPGVYDITVSEPGGDETCVSSTGSPCFTVVGLPPTLTFSAPSSIVIGSSGTGTVTLANPTRGYDYPKTRILLDFSGVPNLNKDKMTLEASFDGTNFVPVTLSNSGADVIGFLGPSTGVHIQPGETLPIIVRIAIDPSVQAATLHTDVTFGDVNSSTGNLTDDIADAAAATKLILPTTYHAVTPTRILDTRFNTGHTGALPAHGTLTLVVGGTPSVPTAATAVAINITATGGTSYGLLVAYPAGVTKPSSSNVNYPQGASAANLAVVPLSTSSHSLTISNESAGSVQVIGDVVGYYAPDGSVYHPLAPARILDTRAGSGIPIAAGATRTLTVAGAGGVPGSGANGVPINVTATRAQVHGYLKVFPTGQAEPTTSNVNFGANQTIANLALVPLGSGGAVTISNHSGGTVHVLVDVQGYFTSTGTASSLRPITIGRVLDTRTSGTGQPIAGNGSVSITLAGKAGLPASGITMVAVNLTVTGPVAGGHITAYALGAPLPTASNANFGPGQTIANLAYVKVTDTGGLTVHNGSGQPIHLIIDIEGWGSSP